MVEFFRSGQSEAAHISIEKTIDTGSNLKVDLFKNIIKTLGLDYRPEYALAEKPIIERLLELRNGVAHGDDEKVELEDYLQLYPRIDDLLVLFGNEVDNAASQQKFRRQHTSQ